MMEHTAEVLEPWTDLNDSDETFRVKAVYGPYESGASVRL